MFFGAFPTTPYPPVYYKLLEPNKKLLGEQLPQNISFFLVVFFFFLRGWLGLPFTVERAKMRNLFHHRKQGGEGKIYFFFRRKLFKIEKYDHTKKKGYFFFEK